MKRIVTLFVVLLLLSSFSMLVRAKETEELPGKELTEKLVDNTPEYVREWLEKLGVDEITPEELLSLKPNDFFSLLLECVKEWSVNPVKIVATVLAVILFCALAEAFKPTADTALGGVFSLVSALAISAALIPSAIDCIRRVCSSASDFSLFITGYIPVFASTVIASGHTAAGGVYSGFMLLVCQIISALASNVLLPLLSIYLAMSVVNGINTSLKINMISDAFKSCVTKTLGFSLTVFVGMMSLQTLVATGSDNLAIKAGKYLVGNFIPVVGSAISEVFLSVQGYIKLIKTCVGWYGVLTAVLIFLPVLIETVIWKASIYVAQMVAQSMNLSSVSTILGAVGSVFTMLIAFVLTFALLLIVTTTIMLMTGMG